MSSPFVESEEEEPSLDSLNRASLHSTVHIIVYFLGFEDAALK
jgi:hypothetical protein